MGDKTGIAWTDATWNPIRGCSRVSEGCRHCYAERETYRLGQRLAQAKYKTLTRLVKGEPHWTGDVRLWEPALDQPLRWRQPRRIFVNSMSDLFHELVPDEWVDRIFAVMALAPRHVFQVLTKRPERMLRYLSLMVGTPWRYRVARDVAWLLHDPGKWPTEHGRWGQVRALHEDLLAGKAWPLPNVWLGVSVEDQATADARIPLLLRTLAAVRWVSYEPALGPVDFSRWLDLEPDDGFESHGRYDCMGKLDWLVVGGESGPGARAFDLAWARSALAQCRAAGVSCFIKQLGARTTNSSEDLGPWPVAPATEIRWRDRKGADPSEWPEDLRVREFPK